MIHFRPLQCFLRLGAKVTKVHTAIKFTQREIFASYIDYNTRQRAATANKFEKDFYKLKNNALYGKTVENIRKRCDLRICNDEETLVKYVSKPTFKRSIKIADELIAVDLLKEKISLNRPVYIGQAVLDLSKLRMYQLYYDELGEYARRFNGNIEILGGDTDSFYLELKNISLKRELLPAMRRDGLLDTSNYPKEHPLHSEEHTAKIGLIKDETCGDFIEEFILLRPKCYSFQTLSNSNCKRAKGVQRGVVKSQFTHDTYRKIYDSESTLNCTNHQIRSQQHQLFTTAVDKVALSINDDKRRWTTKNHSYAYGHYRLLKRL